MASNIYETLVERGFIEQATHEDEIINLLKNEKVTFYIGFDKFIISSSWVACSMNPRSTKVS